MTLEQAIQKTLKETSSWIFKDHHKGHYMNFRGNLNSVFIHYLKENIVRSHNFNSWSNLKTLKSKYLMIKMDTKNISSISFINDDRTNYISTINTYLAKNIHLVGEQDIFINNDKTLNNYLNNIKQFNF